jgi:hypothetical protein
MMRRHLYTLKKPCPATNLDIDLTDDIKEYILANQVWRPPPPVPQPPPPKEKPLTINQTINNYNTMNNLITRMDDFTKLMAYTQHVNTPIMNFSDHIEATYQKRRTCMDEMRSKNIFLDNSGFFDAIDDMTSLTSLASNASKTTIKDLTRLNVLYEDVAQKLKIYDDNEWRSVLFEKGITQIIERIKDHYLDVYERYLIRLYYHDTTSAVKKAYIKEHLQEYYMFIACYDLSPYVCDKADHEITEIDDVGEEEDATGDDDKEDEKAEDSEIIETWNIQEKWYPVFKDVKEKLQTSYVNRVKKDVANIVKRNAKANVMELNRKVIELIRMDEDFKNDVLVNVLDVGCL